MLWCCFIALTLFNVVKDLWANIVSQYLQFVEAFCWRYSSDRRFLAAIETKWVKGGIGVLHESIIGTQI